MKYQKHPIYFDNAASTALDSDVWESMRPYFLTHYGNPGSVHAHGQAAIAAIDKSRDRVANFFGCHYGEIFFTGGATESNNIALQGAAGFARRKYGNGKLHIVTTAIEHPSVFETCIALERNGFEVSFVGVRKDGHVDVSELVKHISPQTFLVSVMYVNHELGTIQPIAEIGKAIGDLNKERLKGGDIPIIFHTDATQAIAWLPCDVNALAVDLLSCSGHKIYGPKGIGALFIRRGVKVDPICFGGSQERGIVPGTQNTPLIVGMGKAVEMQKDEKEHGREKMICLQKAFLSGLKTIPETVINGSLKHRVPSNVNVSFRGITAEALLLSLDHEGISASHGSACASGSLSVSHVFTAIKADAEIAASSLRFTFGKYNTLQEVNRCISVIEKKVRELRMKKI